jgi:integrase
MLGQIVRLALHTGMRAGEIRTLRRSQVNLEKRVVTLTETKNGSTRTVPLSHAAVTVLRTALANPVRPIDTDLVFFGEPGSPEPASADRSSHRNARRGLRPGQTEAGVVPPRHAAQPRKSRRGPTALRR